MDSSDEEMQGECLEKGRFSHTHTEEEEDEDDVVSSPKQFTVL